MNNIQDLSQNMDDRNQVPRDALSACTESLVAVARTLVAAFFGPGLGESSTLGSPETVVTGAIFATAWVGFSLLIPSPNTKAIAK
jgi:hypothetical protein